MAKSVFAVGLFILGSFLFLLLGGGALVPQFANATTTSGGSTSTPSGALGPTGLPDQNCVWYMTFDFGSTTDTCPNRISPTSISGLTFATNTSKFGQGLSILGNAGFITASSSKLNLGGGSFTIMGWINVKSFATGSAIIIGRQGTGTNIDYFFNVNNTRTVQAVQFTSAGASKNALTTVSTLATSTWYYVAWARRLNGSSTIYINSAPDVVGPDDNGSYICQCAKTIGKDPAFTNENANYWLDDFRIYNYAWTDRQIRQYYQFAKGYYLEEAQ